VQSRSIPAAEPGGNVAWADPRQHDLPSVGVAGED